MNLFLDYKKKIFNYLIILNKKKIIVVPDNFKSLTVELPPRNQKSDISCNAAMILAKSNKCSPVDLAEILKENLHKNFKEFKEIKIAKPGFLNISFNDSFWRNYLMQVINFDKKFGSFISAKKKYNIEFVSANPTGPLHVGHCRGAVLGDTISNLLKFNGHTITKEYYVNDHGGQIKNFVLSVYYRILELLNGKSFPKSEDLYPGDYIVDIANKIIKEKKISDFSNLEKIFEKLTAESLNYSMQMIKQNLTSLGIKHDVFTYESNLIKDNMVEKIIKNLKERKFVYEGTLEPPKGEATKTWKKRKQLLFKSSEFGDDIDRALKKEDGSWTYFAADVAYHAHKVNRNFDFLINILGADHAGYIKRINSATRAVSNNKINLICKVSQLVKLFKNGKPFKMSKRKGDYITASDLINEVGKDPVRFMMISRSNDVEIDFDFQKVTEKSKENQIFYIQYAYARINSIFRQLKMSLDDDIEIEDVKFVLNDYEVEILKKISEWPKCIEISVNKLEPHRIPYYLYELVTLFHSYWNLGNENKEYRFIEAEGGLKKLRLSLIKSLAIVIRNGMSILGVSTPKEM